MLDLKLEKVYINTLIPRKDNPNEMTEQRLESLKHSLNTFSYIQPIIVDQHNNIVDGNHRFKAMMQMDDIGVTDEIEVVRVNLETEEDLKLLSQTMNKLRGSHDLKKDISEMEILMGYNPDELKSLLGFDETGLDLMRQHLVMEQEQILNNVDNTINTNQSEKRDVEFKASLKHQCPSCGYMFK